MKREPLVVAIDGPAGVGKSTVARRVAARLGVPYLDTGAMYRALALYALRQGFDPDDPEQAARASAAARIGLRLGPGGSAEVLLGGLPVEPDIRAPLVGDVTSRLAVHASVRAAMVALQRDLVQRLGGVLEGRDIGTLVVPEARFKFFLEADPEVRARRRHAELAAGGHPSLQVEEIARQIAERDERDRTRPVSPLVPAPDAVRIDTGDRTAEEIVESIVAQVLGPS